MIRRHILSIATLLVGSFDADRAQILKSDLKGDCEGATHVITSLTNRAGTLLESIACRA